MKLFATVLLLALAAGSVFSANIKPSITGDYLEVRSCDIYTGPCFANAEMNLTGKEGMLLWSVREGSWKGTKLDGLSVLAVVHTDQTLGNVQYEPRKGQAVLIVDEKATAEQKEALQDLAKTMGGKVIGKVACVQSAPIEAKLKACSKAGCASVRAGNLVEISTSCMGNGHEVCGNEETFYPPLANVDGAYPVFTDVASFNGAGLDVTWQISGKRSAFLASFSM